MKPQKMSNNGVTINYIIKHKMHMNSRVSYKLGGVIFAFCSLIMIILIIDMLNIRQIDADESSKEIIYSEVLPAMYQHEINDIQMKKNLEEYGFVLYEIAKSDNPEYSRNLKKLCYEEYQNVSSILIRLESKDVTIESIKPEIYSSTSRIMNHPSLIEQRKRIYNFTKAHQATNF